MPRISIIGCSGSGKSTLAATIHERHGLPWLELDSVHHQPGWTSIPTPEFRLRVSDFMDRHDDWVIDGNYRKISDLVRSRCTDIVWLDVSLPRVMWQLGRRSLGRVVRRTTLWNGNREGIGALLSPNPKKSVLLWALKTHGRFRGEFTRLESDPALSHVRKHRISEHPLPVVRLEKLLATMGPPHLAEIRAADGHEATESTEFPGSVPNNVDEGTA